MSSICIKIGGSTVDATGLLDELAESLTALTVQGHYPIIVHGGGKDIARQLNLLNKEFSFVEGHRVTDGETMETVQRVLSGDVNKRIVNALLCRGITAIGISGVDGSLFEAEKLLAGGKDIGFVGTIKKVNRRIVELFKTGGIIPVISPVSRDTAGRIYNVNADLAAGELATAIHADHLIYISDVPGVLINKTIQHEIRISALEQLIAGGQITGGMIPKVRSAKEAVERGVGRVHICGWHGPETLAGELAVNTSEGTVIY